MAKRSAIVIAALIVVSLIITAYFFQLQRATYSRSSSGDSNRWGYHDPYPDNWSTPEPYPTRPTDLPQPTSIEHFEIDEDTPETTSPPVETHQTGNPYAQPKLNAVCRTGPSQLYPAQSYVTPNDTFPISGRNYDSTWWRVILIPYQTTCWIWSGLLDISGNTDQVVEIQPPPLPPATATIKAPSSTKTGCWIKDQGHPNGYCRPGKCLPNDFPGTSCSLP